LCQIAHRRQQGEPRKSVTRFRDHALTGHAPPMAL
jgi:hypothetical protein